MQPISRALRVLIPLPYIIPLLTSIACISKPPINYVLESGYGVSDPQFARTMGSLLGPPLIGGNTIKSLRNGAEIFPEMLAAIKAARQTITFETYIYWSGDIGQRFTEALCERAEAGVHVCAILDWVGSNKISRNYIQQMKNAGVELVEYHPLKFYDLGSAQRINNRTHRKLLVIDGKVGFTGGVGIADAWEGNAESPSHWRDMHYRVEGPVVAQLQAAFIDNWLTTTGHVLNDKDHFPELAPVGDQFSQVFKSGAEGGSASMELMFLLSLTAAKKDISIGNAYFIPDDLTIKTLIAARERGVRVRVIVPGPHIDEQVVRRASHGRWGEMLKNGVEIYEFQPTMYHTKLLIVDGLWVSIGSSNLDNRSFRLNDEANLNVLDAKFAAEQTRIFDEDIARSKQMTFDQWKHRPAMERLMEGVSHLFAPLL